MLLLNIFKMYFYSILRTARKLGKEVETDQPIFKEGESKYILIYLSVKSAMLIHLVNSPVTRS